MKIMISLLIFASTPAFSDIIVVYPEQTYGPSNRNPFEPGDICVTGCDENGRPYQGKRKGRKMQGPAKPWAPCYWTDKK